MRLRTLAALLVLAAAAVPSVGVARGATPAGLALASGLLPSNDRGHHEVPPLSGNTGAIGGGTLAGDPAAATATATPIPPPTPDEPEEAPLIAAEPVASTEDASVEVGTPEAPSDDSADGTESELVDAERLTAPEPSEAALWALAAQTMVHARPSFRSPRLGYLAAGARVDRGERAVSFERCPAGWYAVEPRGFVCVGRNATLDGAHPLVSLLGAGPNLREPFPYAYGRSRAPAPHLFLRLPTAEEERNVVEAVLLAGRPKRAALWDGQNFEAPPPWLSTLPGPLHKGRALPTSAFALVRFFEVAGRRYALTRDRELISADRLEPVRPSPFHGVELADPAVSGDQRPTLPLVFVRSRHATLHARGANGAVNGAVTPGRALAYREAVSVRPKPVLVGGVSYLETREGQLLRDEALVHLAAPSSFPAFAKAGQSWVEISILKQALIAWEGRRPVYATLVSTGADGLADPQKTHATVRGVFRLHTKHITVTMDSDAPEDAFDLRDVPWVQYFEGGYALHAAHWHDDFGVPRSHGCVNLAPSDARWLFGWSEPRVPRGWHGAVDGRRATIVWVHP